MLNNVRSIASCFVALSFVVVACGDGDGDEGGTGGGAGKGGSAGTTGGSSGSSGKGGSAGSTAGKGGSAGAAGSTAGNAGTAGSNAGTAGSNAGTAGSGEGGSGGAGDGGTAGSGDGGTGDGGTPGGVAGEGGVPSTGGSAGDDGSGGAPEGGVGGEPATGSGGTGTAGEGGVPSVAGAGGEGGAPVIVFDVLENGGFDTWVEGSLMPPGWTASGPNVAAASFTYSDNGGARTGTGFLDLWLGTDYEVTVSQVISPIPDGSYTLTMYQRGGGPAYTEQYVFATGYDDANLEAQRTAATITGNTYVAITIADIIVTSGQLEIGIHSVGPANAWTNVDDVSLTLNLE